MNLAIVLQFLFLLAASFATAVLALLAVSRIDPPLFRSRGPFGRPEPEECVFLFDGSFLLGATDSARSLLQRRHEEQSDWEVFLESLCDRFPKLQRADVRDTLTDGARMHSDDGKVCLDVSRKNQILRISLGRAKGDGLIALRQSVVEAESQELSALRTVAGNIPCLVWIVSSDEQVCWANGAYLEKAKLFCDDPDTPPWPPKNLFPDASESAERDAADSQRLGLKLPKSADIVWYDVFAGKEGNETIFTAIEASATVRAETALADFVQTLTKTFAQLKTGLAIFDRHRRLSLFNPALTELTRLQPEFLAHRPTLQRVLNALRDKNMIPEPKDYRSWRERIETLESAARDGNYQETWGLPDGQTYRVTAQPHPDGALAILIEDISAEISLARQFRSRLENFQAIFDTQSEAIVVFSPEGQHLMSNLAYAKLWDTGSGLLIPGQSLNDATKVWAERSAPSPVWKDLKEFVVNTKDRVEWYSSIRLSDGRALSARITPLAGGATIVGFSTERLSYNQQGCDSTVPDLTAPGSRPMIDITNQSADKSSNKVS